MQVYSNPRYAPSNQCYAPSNQCYAPYNPYELYPYNMQMIYNNTSINSIVPQKNMYVNTQPHQATFEELKNAVGGQSYSSLEFSLPLSCLHPVSGNDFRTGGLYTKLELPGNGFNVTREPSNWSKISNKPFIRTRKPVHISITGYQLTHEFINANPYVIVTVIAPPRSNVVTTMRKHVAHVVFGLSHKAPQTAVLPQELSGGGLHITLSNFISI